MLAVSRNWRLIAVWGIVAVYSAATFAQPPAKKAPATPEAKKSATTPPPVTPPAAAAPAATPDAKAAVPPPTTAPPGAAATPGPAAANPNRPAAAEYLRLFEEWKNVLKDLRKLKVQYQAAAEGDQAKLKEQWDGLVAKGNDVLAALEGAGLKAYTEAPNEDPQLTRFLVKLADDCIQRDDYTAAARVTDVLIANQCADKQIYDSAAIAAFVLNDYDKAEANFKLAKDAGVLSTYGKDLEPTVKEHKDLWAKENAIREAEAKTDDLPRVKLATSKGDIVVELFENEAPETVGNFVNLVEKGFYNGLTFHRVLKNFMAQGGDPKGDGKGGPGYEIYCECFKPEYRRHFQGTLSMAHSGRDTGGSQFFLTFRPTPHLNGRHTAFGRVVEGMDVLARLQRIDPDKPEKLEPDKIVKAEVLRKRPHEYAPRKVGANP
jgi:cyclophilin family peptidyl-prolyl cis-trans isomerase